MCRLSVVVPVYNSEQYLCQCIDSILGQTHFDLDIILVDDGSTDASGEICDTYAQKDRRIAVIHKKNEGLIKARLSGAEQAQSDYITFVDADDWIVPDTYEQMMKYVGQNDIVITGVYRYYADNEVIADIPVLEEGLYDRDGVEKYIIPYMLWSGKRNAWELDPSLCTKIFKRDRFTDFLRRASGLDIYFGEDTAVIFPFMLEVQSAALIHHCYYYHRQRSQGIVPSYFVDEAFHQKLFSLYEFLMRIFKDSPYWSVLYVQLEHFYMNAVQLKSGNFMNYRECVKDVFPFWAIEKGAKVILYGAGGTGKRFYGQNKQYQFCNIVLWVDQNHKGICLENGRIDPPEQIMTVAFDYIVIAVRSAGIVREIIKILTKMGVSDEEIIWDGILMHNIPEIE